MSDARERLKRLLDGDLEASDIAEDAALVSLADRLYGIKIANVKPVKARDLENQIGGLEQQPQQFGQTPSLMVEVIEPAAAPLPDLPHLAMPNLPSKKSKFSLRTKPKIQKYISGEHIKDIDKIRIKYICFLFSFSI